jgi:feruloyl esterase
MVCRRGGQPAFEEKPESKGVSMRSHFGFSLSGMLKRHRQWEKAVTKAVKRAGKAVTAATPASPPRKSRSAQSETTGRLKQVMAFGSNP